jgi:Peptidase family M23
LVRRQIALLVGILLVAVAGSTSAARATTPDRPATTRAIGPDRLTPLIIGAIAPRPIPVRGSDDRFHIAYELSILNDSPRPATLTNVETLVGKNGRVISNLNRDEIVSSSLLTADFSANQSPVTEIPPGRTLLLVLDDTYATAGAVPTVVNHRVTAAFGPVPPGQTDLASKYPDRVVQTGGPVRISTRRPVVIGPPVTGDGWLAGNGLGDDVLNVHRDVMVPVGGRINGAERFAVDWIRVDPSAKPLADFRGDPGQNDSYLGFDDRLLAVADGTVVSVVSNKPDIPPGTIPTGLPFEQLTGNTVILDIGHGVFALYAHMKQNSATVRVGDEVKQGQVIGRLGNSGNTSQPHLHFQLMSGPHPLTDDNVPWEIDRFTLAGTVTSDGAIAGATAGARKNELPLANSVSDFSTLRR